MKRRWFLIAAGLGLIASLTHAEDVIKTAKGKIEGKVSGMTATVVTISTATENQTVAANQIESIVFTQEPAALSRGRSEALAGKYEEALAALEKIDLDQVTRDPVKQEVEFYQALCAARLAMLGKGKVADAGAQVNQFLANHPDSYHCFAATELVGDLLMFIGQFGKAREYYERLAKAPWPETQMQAEIAIGNTLLAEKNPAEAMKRFENALGAAGKPAEGYQHAASAGKAKCLAEAGKADQALKLAESLIAQADAEDHDTLAAAYNAKGLALAKAGKAQEAVFAFLHVDTLYADNQSAHAEALSHLVQLWKDLKKPQRAVEAQRVLTTQYRESHWAKALKQP